MPAPATAPRFSPTLNPSALHARARRRVADVAHEPEEGVVLGAASVLEPLDVRVRHDQQVPRGERVAVEHHEAPRGRARRTSALALAPARTLGRRRRRRTPASRLGPEDVLHAPRRPERVTHRSRARYHLGALSAAGQLSPATRQRGSRMAASIASAMPDADRGAEHIPREVRPRRAPETGGVERFLVTPAVSASPIAEPHAGA